MEKVFFRKDDELWRKIASEFRKRTVDKSKGHQNSDQSQMVPVNQLGAYGVRGMKKCPMWE